MFALVDDFPSYPKFLPWVAGAQILETTDRERVGRLDIARSGFTESVTTRNVVAPPTKLEMKLLDGPFRLLEGVWTFDAVVDALGDGQAPRGTRVGLTMRFEFKNKMMDVLLAGKFAASCDTLVDAFAKRAKDVYG
jgi:ribosome-associated toxin RatA of RatAB toxin-antitoxin module